ncbi:hypothetical protein ABPG74_009871 [Tetrahymena malaccensis]
MISIQNGYTKQIEPKFIHLIFELEKNQALVDNNMVKNTQFQLFLHRVFFLLSNNLTIENQLESFNNSSESFKENILECKQQFYTFLAYGQILQNKLFKNVQLDKIFFDILLQKDFNQLNVLQQTIYLSIFKVFVENIVGESNFNQMMSPQKQSRIQHALKNQEKKDDNLDEQIQNYFCNLTEQAFQLFIVKQLFYKQKLKDLPKLQYFNNCQWLKQYAMLSEYKIEECINLKRYDLTEEQNEVQDLLQTVQSNIQSSNNIFKNMYQGVINNNQYYPFNMKYSIESEIDLINTNTLDESKNLYECLRCNNLIVFNQQEAYKEIPRCNYCQIDINLNEKNKLKLIQENLSNKESLLSKINIKTGFCLHLSEKKFYEHENFDIKYFCKYLFGLVYFCVLDLSLEQQNSPYNKKQIVNLKNTSNGNLEQNETLLINKILQLGPQIQAKDYLKKQIQLALNNYYKFTDKVLSITQKQSLYILHDMIKYLLSLDLVQAVDIKNSESINQKISDSCQAQLQNLREKYCNKLFQVLELQQIVDYQIDDQPTLLYKSLKYASKYVDNKIAYQKIKDKIIREDIQKNYPILDFLLEVQNNKYSECLKIFIQFYHKQFNLYQFKYQYSKIQNLTLKQEFNQKQDQLYEFQIVTFKYNELIEQIKSETQNESNKEIQDLGKMSEEALFIDFLFTQKNKPTKFFTILKYLCEYQNQLIEQLLSLCQKNNSNSNVKRLYQELKIQLFNKQNEKECKPLQNISSFQIINANSDINLEQFSSLGFEEGDGINFNVIFDLENLQYELCRTIFNNACLIDIKQTAQIKFLNSPEQIVKMPLYQSKFQELSPCVIRHLDQIIKNKDHAFEILQKITTAQNLINFELESPDNSILSAMESLRLKFEPQKLSEVLGQIKLKDIKGFTTYIQDQVLDKLIQHCKKNFQNNCNQQNIEKIIQTFTQNKAQLKELRKIIGRFIIKMSSQEKLLDHQEKSLIQLLEEEEIIQKDHPILAQENLKTLKIQDCFVLFERCQSQINNLESQEVSNQNENSQRLLIEDFKDE